MFEVVEYMKTTRSSRPSPRCRASCSRTAFDTKGQIGVVQAKLSVLLGEVVEVPSVTWSSQRELIPDTSIFRVQVGLAIDLDGLMR